MLLPAGVLILVVLGAFAVDAAVVFLGEREVANLAAGIANDVAGAALDRPGFAGAGDVVLDPARAEEVVDLALAAYRPDYLEQLAPVAVTFPADDTVSVTIAARVGYLFAAALPGGADGLDVQATATAVAQEEG